MEKRYGPKTVMPVHQQSYKKIIIDIDGNSYSARFPVVLSTGSVVFKMAAFEDVNTIVAVPWEHYVPVKLDSSDLEESI